MPELCRRAHPDDTNHVHDLLQHEVSKSELLLEYGAPLLDARRFRK